MRGLELVYGMHSVMCVLNRALEPVGFRKEGAPGSADLQQAVGSGSLGVNIIGAGKHQCCSSCSVQTRQDKALRAHIQNRH